MEKNKGYEHTRRVSDNLKWYKRHLGSLLWKGKILFFIIATLLPTLTITCMVASGGEVRKDGVAVSATCTDSDGRLNYDIYGYVTFKNNKYEARFYDYCSNSTVLIERYCSSPTTYSSNTYTCPNGCFGGKCIIFTPATSASSGNQGGSWPDGFGGTLNGGPYSVCGNGICEWSENNTDCPADCPPLKGPEESPFGVLEPFVGAIEIPSQFGNDPEYFDDIGIKFAREGLFVWEDIEETPGNYNWGETDAIVNLAQQKNAKLLFTIWAINLNDQQTCRLSGDPCYGDVSCTPCNMTRYSEFLTASINRYKDSVKYWQVGNELNHAWKETPESYADFAKFNYDIIKQNCPDCMVVLGGVSSRPSGYYSFYRRVIKKAGVIKNDGNGETFDIFDFHWAGYYNNYTSLKDNRNNQTYYFKPYVNDIKNDMRTNNINADIWITEMGTYSSDPVDETGIVNPPQTERQQAVELVKRYIYSVSADVKKIFWVKIMEWYNFAGKGVNRYYDNTGLVNNPTYDNDSSKKLSYYTYKKAVETLEGSDWDNIQIIRENTGNDGIYVYKLLRGGKPVWIVWNDSAQTKNFNISGITSPEVEIIQAIPRYDAGWYVTNYSTAFDIETRTVVNGNITLNLDDEPVYVLE